MSNIRRTQSTAKTDDTNGFPRKNSLQKDLVRVTQELSQMKKELTHKKSSL